MEPLSSARRRALRAQAHHLEPVVTIGQHGLTASVLHEIDVALLAHDLVKVRVLAGDHDAREGMLAQACAALDCAPVQHVGKVLVLWRPNPERKTPQKAAPAPVKKPARPPRKRPGARAPLDPVRERRRSAAKSPDSARRRRGG